MQATTFRHILTQISAIGIQYKKVLELTGEHFNIFRLLKFESNEVRLHSALLGALLDPRGSHGFGNVFLNLFVTQLGIGDFKTESVNVDVEAHTGFINEALTEGGRIDICIRNAEGHAIIIENKIYAGDQTNQLLRYSNYASRFTKSRLYYLTLEGKEPSNGSTGKVLISGEHFHSISYRSEILSWLQACRKEAVMQPMVRETITQYIYLIKYLTGTTMNTEMQKTIVSELIRNDESIEATFAIAESANQVRTVLIKYFIDGLESGLSKYAGDIVFDDNFGQRGKGFTIKKANWKFHFIRFEFGGDFGGLYCGIKQANSIIQPKSIDIRKFIAAERSERDWIWWKYVLEGPMTGSDFVEIKNGTTRLYEVITNLVGMLSEVVDQIEVELKL